METPFIDIQRKQPYFGRVYWLLLYLEGEMATYSRLIGRCMWLTGSYPFQILLVKPLSIKSSDMEARSQCTVHMLLFEGKFCTHFIIM